KAGKAGPSGPIARTSQESSGSCRLCLKTLQFSDNSFESAHINDCERVHPLFTLLFLLEPPKPLILIVVQWPIALALRRPRTAGIVGIFRLRSWGSGSGAEDGGRVFEGGWLR